MNQGNTYDRDVYGRYNGGAQSDSEEDEYARPGNRAAAGAQGWGGSVQ